MLRGIKERIAKYERHINGLDLIGDVYVVVKNLKIRKNKYIADIIFYDDDVVERHNNCEYPKNKLI